MQREVLHEVRAAAAAELRHQIVHDRIDDRLAPLRHGLREERLLEDPAIARMFRRIHRADAAPEADTEVQLVRFVGEILRLGQ
jgi:hypothetical protein